MYTKVQGRDTETTEFKMGEKRKNRRKKEINMQVEWAAETKTQS